MTVSTTHLAPSFRSSRRLSVTVPYHAFRALQERSDFEGRSISNLAAYLIESSLEASQRNGSARRPAAPRFAPLAAADRQREQASIHGLR